MSQWHREHPELVGTPADPWMIHESYRRYVPAPERDRDDDARRDDDESPPRESE